MNDNKENKKIVKRCIEAVAHLHPDELQKLIDDGKFVGSLLKDTYKLSIPFPLQYITACWDIILGADDWSEEDMVLVKRSIEKNNKIKSIFLTELGINIDEVVVPFDNLKMGDIFKEEDEDVSDFYIIFNTETDEDEINLIKNTRQIDRDLYAAVATMKYTQAEKLLKDGANPSVYLHYCAPEKLSEYEKYYNDCDQDSSDEGEAQYVDDFEEDIEDEYYEPVMAMSRVATEYSFLSEQLGWIAKSVEPREWQSGSIRDIVGLAAYTRMYKLLSAYCS